MSSARKDKMHRRNRPFSNNYRESSDKSGKPIVCFVCDQMCHISKEEIFLIGHIGLQLILYCVGDGS